VSPPGLCRHNPQSPAYGLGEGPLLPDSTWPCLIASERIHHQCKSPGFGTFTRDLPLTAPSCSAAMHVACGGTGTYRRVGVSILLRPVRRRRLFNPQMESCEEAQQSQLCFNLRAQNNPDPGWRPCCRTNLTACESLVPVRFAFRVSPRTDGVLRQSMTWDLTGSCTPKRSLPVAFGNHYTFLRKGKQSVRYLFIKAVGRAE